MTSPGKMAFGGRWSDSSPPPPRTAPRTCNKLLSCIDLLDLPLVRFNIYTLSVKFSMIDCPLIFTACTRRNQQHPLSLFWGGCRDVSSTEQAVRRFL
eukprot:768520-Hanusia_phi.AAC.11